MKLYRRWAVFSLMLMLAVMIASCNATPTTAPTPATVPTATAAPTTVAAQPTVILTNTPLATAVLGGAETTPKVGIAPTSAPITVVLGGAETTPKIGVVPSPTGQVRNIPPTPTASGAVAFPYGVASGDMNSDSAVLWTRTSVAASIIPEYSESPNFESVSVLPAIQTTAASDFTAKIIAKNLKSGTKYYYRFRAGSSLSPVGSFKTAYAPDQKANLTMAFTGDADWKWKPYPILSNLSKENLDFFFFLGDLIYETTDLQGTTAVEDLNGYRFKYRENREPRPNDDSKSVPMLDLYRNFGQYSVFDNHETGPSKADKNAPPYNEGGAQVNGQYVNQSEGFKARIQAYREYQPVREETGTGTGDPRSDQTSKFYRTTSWGANVELIVADDRSYRDIRLANSDVPEASSCSRTMLGSPQLKWLQDSLLAAKQRQVVWKVVVVSSPIQQLGRASQISSDMDGSKSWAGGYNCERNKLLKFIDDNEINNVVFLTTDNHYTVINNLKYNTVPEDPKSPLKAARNAFEILTGPLGASAGNPAGLKVDTKGLDIREADRKILATWNGDIPNTDGQMKGLKQAGLDPIGLEADFPGLDVASLKSLGGTPGTVEPINFASFNTYAYAVLNFTDTSLSVQVKGFPIVSDPTTLATPETLKEYLGRKPADIFSFQVKAQ